VNLEEQIAAFRDRTGDTEAPYLWSDQEVTLFLNAAQDEAAERAYLIFDATTDEVCEIPIVAGTATYDLHPSILKIQRAKLDLGNRPLVETSIEKLDEECQGWETTSGNPCRFFQTSDTTITLQPNPTVNDTLRLRAFRLPLVRMEDDADEPEIAAKHHYRAIDWALRCAYLKQDSETLDKGKAAEHEASFTASFGERPDANVQRKRRDRRPPVVRMNHF
jgi:hypothetical protein